MKEKKIKVIVEGRISGGEMGGITGGGITIGEDYYCVAVPGQPTAHIAPPCVEISGSYNSDPCNTYNSGGCTTYSAPCMTGYVNPPYCSPSAPGTPTAYISDIILM